jgi:site-specific recombinase XerC
LKTEDIDLGTAEVKVLGKGRKLRTVHLIDYTVGLLCSWLDVRQMLALDGVCTLFVVAGPNGTGTALGPRGIRYVVDKYLTELGLKAEGISGFRSRTEASHQPQAVLA